MMDDRDFIQLVNSGEVLAVQSEMKSANTCHDDMTYRLALASALNADNIDMLTVLLSEREWDLDKIVPIIAQHRTPIVIDAIMRSNLLPENYNKILHDSLVARNTRNVVGMLTSSLAGTRNEAQPHIAQQHLGGTEILVLEETVAKAIEICAHLPSTLLKDYPGCNIDKAIGYLHAHIKDGSL